MQQQGFFFREFGAVERFDVKDAVEVVAVENRQAHGGERLRKNRAGTARSNADVIVSQAVFELLGYFGQNFVRVERGDGVLRNQVQQAEVARLRAFFLKQAGILNGDACFAGQDAKQFQMAFVEGPVLIGKHTQGADDAVVGDQRHATERTRSAQRLNPQLPHFADIVIANEDRLARTKNVLRQVIANGP